MDHRAPPLGAPQRPRPPQRAISGGPYGVAHQLPKRPTLPSRLTNVRSASQPVVDLTDEAKKSSRGNSLAFLENQEKVVRSPDVTNLEDDDGEPPAKKPKTMGEEFKSESDNGEADGQDKAYEVMPGSPLPTLPKTKPLGRRVAGPRRHRFGIDPGARKAHGIDPPAVATKVPPPKKALDFSPWTGTHQEDVLSETVVKGGYFDKAPGTNQSDLNSAKATIWPNLSQKNHHGLTLLGHLFTAVMEKRQAIGRCTAPSTFKPPPRVTVTDTKREAWLRDLANPDVPLRKQSRTIPHGIRGKLLMEQCLSKMIPLRRAVWLAKCVGANELRAFRRKGVSGSAAASGEQKWVREWTEHVEQFLEGVIAMCGQQDWRQKMDYAAKLATAFYSERLLDTQHYLDWIVSSLTEAPLDRLPIWIIMAQIYWKEITAYGRRGRKLAESLLEHLHRITEAGVEANAPLKTRLQRLVVFLGVANRGCLIIPRTWEKYRYLFVAGPDSEAKNTQLRDIIRRNERIAGPLHKTATNTRSPLLDLFTALDSVGLDIDVEKLSEKCLGLVKEGAKLVLALLDWCSTLYRTGVARIYLAARMISHLHDCGHDTDAMILQYLATDIAPSTFSADHLHQVIVELVRLKAFSVGRYLQWLITSGVLSTSEGPTCATSLIAALPSGELPRHVFNTWSMLMRRLGYTVNEQAFVNQVLARIDEVIATPMNDNVVAIQIPEGLTPSVKFTISQSLYVKVSMTAKDFGISLRAFEVSRDIIERVRDVASLAQLVMMTISTDNTALLATVADTINLHADSFAALGELSRMVESITEQYLLLRSQQPSDRSLILALSGLAKRIPSKTQMVKLLDDDLTLFQQQSSVTVCSPASDSLIGMHASTLDSDDDIDAVFASGNSMDDQLMQRVFTRIMQRASKPQPPGPELVSRVGGWLNQLRSVDSSGTFDKLLQDYLHSVIGGGVEESLTLSAVAALVSSNCVTLGTVADMAKELKSPERAAHILRLFFGSDNINIGLHQSERYRYRLEQERCQIEQVDALTTLIRTAAEGLEASMEKPALVQFLIRCVSLRPGSVRRIFEGTRASETLSRNAGRLMTAILQQDVFVKDAGNTLDTQALIDVASPLSIRFCMGALMYFKHATNFTARDEENLGETLLQAFVNGSEVWPQLLECAGEAANRKLHEWAQDQLLLTASTDSNAQNEDERAHVERCLDLVAITRKFSNSSHDTSTVATIAAKVKELEKKLSELEGIDSATQSESSQMLYRLRIILQLSVMQMHGSLDESTRQSDETLLVALCTLLVQPRLQTNHDLLEYIFDLASTLSDKMPPVTNGLSKLQQHAKLPPDARLTSILGSNPDPTESWLVLASQLHPPVSQQQRALSKIPSQQAHSGARVVSTGQGQSNLQHHQRWPSQNGPGSLRQDNRQPVEMKTTPFPLRRWEIMSDATPVQGENDASLSLALFGARRV